MFVSNILNLMGENADISKLRDVIAGCVGMGAAIEFAAWCRNAKGLPAAEDVLDGRYTECPESPDALHALLSSVAAYAVGREGAGIGGQFEKGEQVRAGGRFEENERIISDESAEEGLSCTQIDNLCRFCADIPVDYAVGFYKTMLPNEKLKRKITGNAHFKEWGRKHRRALASSGYEV